MNDTISLKPLTVIEREFAWKMLALSAYATDVEVRRDPQLKAYAEDLMELPGDFGIFACREKHMVGAVWIRHFDRNSAPYFYLEATPHELVIAVEPAYRKMGIGSLLLKAAIAEARDRHLSGVCLNTRINNPAIGLYERSGFKRVLELRNRVGGWSLVMQYFFS